MRKFVKEASVKIGGWCPNLGSALMLIVLLFPAFEPIAKRRAVSVWRTHLPHVLKCSVSSLAENVLILNGSATMKKRHALIDTIDIALLKFHLWKNEASLFYWRGIRLNDRWKVHRWIDRMWRWCIGRVGGVRTSLMILNERRSGAVNFNPESRLRVFGYVGIANLQPRLIHFDSDPSTFLVNNDFAVRA